MHEVQLPSEPTSGLNSIYSIPLSLLLPSPHVLYFLFLIPAGKPHSSKHNIRLKVCIQSHGLGAQFHDACMRLAHNVHTSAYAISCDCMQLRASLLRLP